MDKELFGLKHLIYTENETVQITNTTFKGIADNYPNIIDVFFKLSYFKGELDSVDTPSGEFQSFCYDSYIQAPYTLWVIFDLYQKGYYLEAITMYRHCLEVFVQLKYFHKYTEKLKGHLTGRYVNFSTMFIEFTSREFYEKHYGHLLSSFAHGKVAKNIFRYEHISRTDRKIVMGCQYNPDHATLIMNQTVPLLFGYLNQFLVFYPNNTLDKNSTIYSSYMEAMDWMKYLMANHKEKFPQSHSWFENFDKLIYP